LGSPPSSRQRREGVDPRHTAAGAVCAIGHAAPHPVVRGVLIDLKGGHDAGTAPTVRAARPDELGYQTAQALYVTARLGVADCLADGVQASDTIAHLTGTHAPSLRRLLRVLASMGLCTEDAQGRFGLTALGACLRADVPESARSRVLLYGQPWLWRPFMALS